MLPLQGAWVWSLVKDPESHAAQSKKRKATTYKSNPPKSNPLRLYSRSDKWIQGIRSDKVPEELRMEVRDIVQEAVIKTIPKKKKCKKAKWLSEGALKTAE